MEAPKVEENKDPKEQENEKKYPSTKALIPIMGGIYLAFFLVALVCSSFSSSVHSI